MKAIYIIITIIFLSQSAWGAGSKNLTKSFMTAAKGDLQVENFYNGTDLDYVCSALPGASLSDPVWQVKKITMTGANISKQVFPTLSQVYNFKVNGVAHTFTQVSMTNLPKFKCSDRASLDYTN